MSPIQVFDERDQGERDDPDGGLLETISLLQEEVARLEAELLARDDDDRGRSSADALVESARAEAERAAHDELDRLRTELAGRDETLNLVLDQLRLVEEAEAAGRAEWEQLAAWVADMEERVERAEVAPASAATEEVERRRREAEDLRAELGRERRAWSERQAELEREIERVQELLAAAPGKGGGDTAGPTAEAMEAIEADNRRLRKLHKALEAEAEARLAVLREELDSAKRQAEEASGQLIVVQDLRDREQREYEIAVASLRAQATRAAAADAARPGPVASAGHGELEPDMRIHAFRQHLKEIHEREAEARRNSGLSARLARLWGRTAPER
ncbi:hypothetical protein [Aquisphaera insulae]|uniref:hypothetical protein n=1 Tax=Aquisphaera insulae TaxID=2712864 RepID=UPI0013EA37A0|nr:hypothetical protein [Aquisphaera insulae]